MFRKNNEQEPDMEFYTIFDSKAKTYNEPFPGKNRETVLRDFANAFRNPEAPTKNRYYMNAEDFSIFKIGKFSTATGQIEPVNLEHVANLHDLRAMVSPGALSST